MRSLNISKDIIPIGEFKTGISKWFKSIREKKHPIIITQNGRPAGVLISPEEYDTLLYNKNFTDSIKRGLHDIETGNIHSHSEFKKAILDFRKDRS